jgi:hypothetical protein
VGIHFVDIQITAEQRAPIRFSFLWLDSNQWEGRDYEVAVRHTLATPDPERTHCVTAARRDNDAVADGKPAQKRVSP